MTTLARYDIMWNMSRARELILIIRDSTWIK